MENRKNADELLAERFGERGFTEREQFKEQAFSYYIGEIIKVQKRLKY